MNRATIECTSEGTGGIVGYSYIAQIYNCQNEGRVNGSSAVGGIVGKLYARYMVGALSYYEELTNILNCVNYGSVRGTSAIGGVVGNIHGGRVFNSANFGSVTAPSHVGGIAGKNTDDCGSIRNCYNAGTVTGSTNDYVGAIIGQNTDNKGYVYYSYYLEGSATNNSGTVKAAGKSGGYVNDEYTNLMAAPFTADLYVTSQTEGINPGKLIDLLNGWVETNGESGTRYWEMDNGYPKPIGENK